MAKKMIELDPYFVMCDIINNHTTFSKLQGSLDNPIHRALWAQHIFFYFLLNRSQFGRQKNIPTENGIELVIEQDWAVAAARWNNLIPQMTFGARRHVLMFSTSAHMPTIPFFEIDFFGFSIQVDDAFQGVNREWLLKQNESPLIGNMVLSWLREVEIVCDYTKTPEREVLLKSAYLQSEQRDDFAKHMRDYQERQIRTRFGVSKKTTKPPTT